MRKSIRRAVVTSAAAAAISLAAQSTRAAAFYWDTSDAAGLQGGDSTWGTAVVNWNPASDGSGARQAWVRQSDAVFNAAATVEMASHINATSVTFNAPTTINSGTENDPSPFGQP